MQAACRACTRCVEDGVLPAANPTFQGGPEATWLRAGQAPGPGGGEIRRSVRGRAGRGLWRGMQRVGFASEEEFRERTYIASLIRCFPGRNAAATGDLPPPRRAILNGAGWLEEEMRLLRPAVVIPVGNLAITRFLGPGNLQERVGRSFGRDPVLLPLPHPSGTSRWLHSAANRARLQEALALPSTLPSATAP